jgi:hypothetical protein
VSLTSAPCLARSVAQRCCCCYLLLSLPCGLVGTEHIQSELVRALYADGPSFELLLKETDDIAAQRCVRLAERRSVDCVLMLWHRADML